MVADIFTQLSPLKEAFDAPVVEFFSMSSGQSSMYGLSQQFKKYMEMLYLTCQKKLFQ